MIWYFKEWNLTRLNYLTMISAESTKIIDHENLIKEVSQIYDRLLKVLYQRKGKGKETKWAFVKFLSFNWLFCKQLRLEYIN